MRIGQRVSFGPYRGVVRRISENKVAALIKWDGAMPYHLDQWMRITDLHIQPEITEYPAHLLIHEADDGAGFDPNGLLYPHSVIGMYMSRMQVDCEVVYEPHLDAYSTAGHSHHAC